MDSSDIIQLSEVAQNPEAMPAMDPVPLAHDATRTAPNSPATSASSSEHAASQTAVPQEAPGKISKPPGASHKREISNISDFAYRPGESGFTGNPSAAAENRPANALTNVVSNISFDSFQTTAVNSERGSSDASSNEASRQSASRETERLDMLRKILEAAKPGVTVKINVKPDGLTSGSALDFEVSEEANQQSVPTTWKQLCISELRA